MTRQEYYDDKHKKYGKFGGDRKDKILRLLGRVSGMTVLDIGCADGGLGANIKKMGNKVFGIDLSERAVAKARAVLDGAFVCNIEAEYPPLAAGSIDAIVISEVVEHLFFPEEALSRVHKLLVPNGRMILTTPNFLFYSNRIRMLFGRFCYTETGLLDRSHVHFFVKESLEKAILTSRFRIDLYDNTYTNRLPERVARLWPSMFAFQFVLRAIKT